MCQRYFSDNVCTVSCGNSADFYRSSKMGFIRAFVIAPFIHVYYPWLVKIYPGKETKKVFVRVILGKRMKVTA